MSKLKELWPWLLGLIGAAVVWLKFVNNPRVASEARAKLKLKELDKRQEKLQESSADTHEQEAKLEAKKARLQDELDKKTNSRDASDAVDRLSGRFGWGSD